MEGLGDLNMADMFGKVMEMQQKMSEAQQALEGMSVEAEAGGGMVKVTATGAQRRCSARPVCRVEHRRYDDAGGNRPGSAGGYDGGLVTVCAGCQERAHPRRRLAATYNAAAGQRRDRPGHRESVVRSGPSRGRVPFPTTTAHSSPWVRR